MEPLVSMIVPVYKVEQYLQKCIDSLVNQTYKNLEIILVDDGSPDNCGRICDENAAKDPRIKVIHKVNAGMGFARNAGIDASTGELLMFVDSDDYLSPDAVQLLYERMQTDSSDMVIGKHTDAYEDGRTDGRYCDWMQDAVLLKQDVFDYLGKARYLPVAAWGKLYKKSLFEGIRFPANRWGEDVWIHPLIVDRCERISVLDVTVYYYFQRTTSIMHQKTDRHILDAIEASLHMALFLWKRGHCTSGRRWFANVLDKAMQLDNKRVARERIDEYFSSKEKRQLLKGAGIKTKGKYVTLYIPGIYSIIRKVKRG